MASPTTVTIDGTETLELSSSPAIREQYGWTSERFVINCHTGRVIEGRWTGVPLVSIVDAGVLPADTTHLLVHGADGHRVCVEIRRALEALLGFVCEEVDRGRDEGSAGPGTGTESSETAVGCETTAVVDTPRFLAPDIDSSRAVRNVHAIEPVSLAPDEDPHELEHHRRKDEEWPAPET